MMRPTIRTAGDERLSDVVIDAVSAATGTDPLALPRFHDVIDLDALDRLFRGGDDGRRSDARAVFEVGGCEVHVAADGRVVAIPPESNAGQRQTASG